MATVPWKKMSMTPAERREARMNRFRAEARDELKAMQRSARDNEDARVTSLLWDAGSKTQYSSSARFRGMTKKGRADALFGALGYGLRGSDAQKLEVLKRLYDMAGAYEAAETAGGGPGTQFKDELGWARANGLPASTGEFRTMFKNVLGNPRGWHAYESDPRIGPFISGWAETDSRGDLGHMVPGLSGRPSVTGADYPESNVELNIQRAVPGFAQPVVRPALRAVRGAAAEATGVARLLERSADWFVDYRPPGGKGSMDRLTDRWRSENYVDRLVDKAEGRGGFVSDTAEELMKLYMLGGAFGKALPAVFGLNVGVDTYDAEREAGVDGARAAAYGLGHGALDAALWSVSPSKAVRGSMAYPGTTLVGRGPLPFPVTLPRVPGPGRLAHLGETYGKMYLSGKLSDEVSGRIADKVGLAARQDGSVAHAPKTYRDLVEQMANAKEQEWTMDERRRLGDQIDAYRNLMDVRLRSSGPGQRSLDTMLRDRSVEARAEAVLPPAFDPDSAAEELKFYGGRVHQAAKGGRSVRAADGAGETFEAAAPTYSRVNWYGLPNSPILAHVHKEDMTPVVQVRGRVLPEGQGDENFPYAFPTEGEFSPEGVPWSSLDPGEVNANAFAYADGHAVTKARGDYFALTDNERKVFDRLTKEGVNPRDERVRRLRAMKEAGDRSADEVKRLAWAERKNRDIELAYRLGGKDWRDYYVETTANMIGGDRLREEIAGDINARADHLRGHYDYLAELGRGREAEQAMDELHAFRKRAQYLAARYGLHPELARMDRDRTFLETVRGGQLGQRLSIRGVYPQSLYVETGHYGTEPSKYAGAAKALSDRFGPAVQFDPALSPQAADAAAYADEYRRDVDAYSFWNMPYAPDESLNSRYSLPVLDGETEAPPWLQRAVRRRRKLTRAKPTRGDLEGGETSEGDLNGDGTAVDHGADVEDFKAEEAKDPDVETWIDKASAARENGEGESKAGDPDVAAWVDRVSTEREMEARGAQDQPKQVGPAMSGEAAKAGLQMKQVGPAMSGDAARAGLQMKQVGPAMSGNDAKAGLQMKQIGPDMGGGGSDGLAERKANADVYQERIEAAGLTGKEAARALRDMVYSGNTDRLDKAEEAKRQKEAEDAMKKALESSEEKPLPGIRPRRRKRT